MPYTDLEKSAFQFLLQFLDGFFTSRGPDFIFLWCKRIPAFLKLNAAPFPLYIIHWIWTKITPVVYIRTVFILLICFSLTNLWNYEVAEIPKPEDWFFYLFFCVNNFIAMSWTSTRLTAASQFVHQIKHWVEGFVH